MTSETESYTTGCIIRAYYIYKNVWSRYIGECYTSAMTKEVQKSLSDQAEAVFVLELGGDISPPEFSDSLTKVLGDVIK